MTTYFSKHFNELLNYSYLTGFFFIITFFINYWFCDQWIYFLLNPLFKTIMCNYLIVTEITEIFFIKITLSIFLSLVFAIIFFFLQIWSFLSTGLFKIENYFITKWFFLFIINLIISIYLIIVFVIPSTWVFFINFLNNSNNYLYNYFFEPKLATYLYFIMKTLIIILLIFQYPLIIIFCLNINLLTIKTLIKFRKFLYLFLYILTALITPPSVEIQLIVISCFIFILEFVIFSYIYRKL